MQMLLPVSFCLFVSIATSAAQTGLLSSSTALPNGVRVAGSGSLMEVTALREDVLRVRLVHGAALPEDASWAVLPAARTATVHVTAEADGFQTSKLRVGIDAKTLALTVRDLAGNVLQQDAEPVQWDGSRYRISKKKAQDEHFFHDVEHGQLRLAGVDQSDL